MSAFWGGWIVMLALALLVRPELVKIRNQLKRIADALENKKKDE
ncbi:MAG: hypothetical protein Q8R55_03025 [Candidatus Taylorbacteria bacterium]|nr:hypothetical protein [Candidatus Taylorbacteria bacterium]